MKTRDTVRRYFRGRAEWPTTGGAWRSVAFLYRQSQGVAGSLRGSFGVEDLEGQGGSRGQEAGGDRHAEGLVVEENGRKRGGAGANGARGGEVEAAERHGGVGA